MKTILTAIGALAGLVGCSSPSAVTAKDVVQVSVCPNASGTATASACTATPYADGTSVIFVQACSQSPSVSAKDRRTDMQVGLHSTHGTWVGHAPPDPGSVTVPFGANSCVRASLTADQTPGVSEIDATLLGYTDTATILQLPAPIGHVDVSATSLPPLQGTTSSTIQLVVAARATTGGLPSLGTRVDFSVTNLLPSSSNVALSPLSATLDAQGNASVNIFVSGAVTSFTVVASVTPPPHPELGVTPLEPVVGSLNVVRQ